MIEVITRRFFKPKVELPREYSRNGWEHELLKLRRAFAENIEGYPHRGCIPTAREIEQWLGFPIETGSFRVDIPVEGTTLLDHTWNRDPLGNKVDLTWPQFNEWMHTQNRIRTELVVARPGTELFNRYLVNV